MPTTRTRGYGQRRLLTRVVLVLLLLAADCCVAPGQVFSSPKVELPLNGLWSVTRQGTTTTVTVPANIAFFGGISLWQRSFVLNLPTKPKVAYLEFGGIVHTAVVRLNGTNLGRLVALTRARFDVADALNLSGSNLLEVEVDDRLLPDTVPGGPTDLFVPALGAIAYTFPVSWAPNPGIVRDVSLVYSDRPAIMNVFAAAQVSDDLTRADVLVRIQVQGEPAANLTAQVAVTYGTTQAASCLASVTPSHELACVLSVQSPQLWSPDTPTLYGVWAVLRDSSGVADIVLDRTGFRKLEIRQNQLYLNNRRLFLRGISRHDVYGAQGFVADDAQIQQDLERMRALGINYVRSIHYPPDPKFTQRADELGMLVSEEIPAYATFSNATVIGTACEMVRAMVERDFNRPSVIFWITGNGNSLNPGYLAQTAATAKAIDAGRPVSFVIDDPSSFTPASLQQNAAALRAAGMNLYLQNGYWFDSTIAQLVPALPSDMPSIISEWAGSEGDDRGPIGDPLTLGFPNWSFPPTGVFPEQYEATTLLFALHGWLPYVNCTATNNFHCISGLAYFTWQDTAWPGMPYFYLGHYPTVRTGLVYEDRTQKLWPTAIFQYGMGLLPQ